MRNLLQINTSLFAEDGQSSKLARQVVADWRTTNPNGIITIRDLSKHPVPHLTADRFNAFLTPAEKRSAEQAAVAAFSDELIAELHAADVIVIGLPMYNFGIPSALKAYFDHIARAGVTFKYSAQGPVGLLTDKRVYVLATRGGLYVGTPLDTATHYVRDFLKFLGLDSVEFIYAEGLALDTQQREQGLADAQRRIAGLAA
jgi:FMN-dependent NADH-azoreductase